MPTSTYKVIEIVGSSPESWEAATTSAIATASKTLHDLRVAEVVKLDVHIEEGKVVTFRTRLTLSFKYDASD